MTDECPKPCLMGVPDQTTFVLVPCWTALVPCWGPLLLRWVLPVPNGGPKRAVPWGKPTAVPWGDTTGPSLMGILQSRPLWGYYGAVPFVGNPIMLPVPRPCDDRRWGCAGAACGVGPALGTLGRPLHSLRYLMPGNVLMPRQARLPEGPVRPRLSG